MLRLLTYGGASFLLPTPSASRYGSNKGGAAGRVGKERPSLDTMAKRARLPAPVGFLGRAGGLLSPLYVEWMMGFPIEWTVSKR
jgi:hypothetical protein